MNKLQEAIEWAKQVKKADTIHNGVVCFDAKAISKHVHELVKTAEQAERAKFGSEDLIAASINAFQYNQNETNDVRAFELGFNEGAAWVLKRMKDKQ